MKHTIPTRKVALSLGIGLLMLVLTVQGAVALSSSDITAWWDMDECSGTTITDEKNGSTGTISGASLSWNCSEAGKPANIGVVTVGTPTDGDKISLYDIPYNTSSTISIWAKSDSNAADRSLFSHYESGTSRLIFYQGGTSNSLRLLGDADIDMEIGTFAGYGWQLYHIVILASGSTSIYINDSASAAATDATGSGINPNVIADLLDTSISTAAWSWDGSVGPVMVFNKALNSTERGQLYNGGAGVKYATLFGTGATNTTYTVNVKDLFDLGNLQSANVTFYNATYSTSALTDASGNAVLSLNSNASPSSFSFNVSKSGYFNSGVGSVAANSTGSANITQAAYTNLTVYSLITNSTVPPNFTLGVQGGRNYTLNGSETSIYLRTGQMNFTWSKSGWYGLTFSKNVTAGTNSTTTASGAYNALASITAQDVETSGAVSNFTVNATNTTWSYAASVTTTNGTALFPLEQGLSFFLLMDATGYAYANTTLSAANATPSYQFGIYTQNSIQISIYDEFLGGLIVQNVSVELAKNATTLTYSTVNGTLYADLLDAGMWTLTFNSNGYDERIYFVTVGERTTQTLDAYLLNSSLSEATSFTIKNAQGNFILAATLTMQDEVNGSWVTIAQKETDFFGQAFFPLQYAHEYRLIIEADGYVTKTATFERVSSSYSITLSADNTQNYVQVNDEFTYSIAPQSVAPNVTAFNLSTSSPDGRIQWFYIRVLHDGVNYSQNVSGSPSGGVAQVTVNLTGQNGDTLTAYYLVKSTGLSEPFSMTRRYYVYGVTPGNYTFDSFMRKYGSEWSGSSKMMAITLAAVLGGVSIGLWIMEGGLVIAAAVFLLGGWYEWVDWTYVVLVVGALFGLLIWGRR